MQAAVTKTKRHKLTGVCSLQPSCLCCLCCLAFAQLLLACGGVFGYGAGAHGTAPEGCRARAPRGSNGGKSEGEGCCKRASLHHLAPLPLLCRPGRS